MYDNIGAKVAAVIIAIVLVIGLIIFLIAVLVERKKKNLLKQTIIFLLAKIKNFIQ